MRRTGTYRRGLPSAPLQANILQPLQWRGTRGTWLPRVRSAMLQMSRLRSHRYWLRRNRLRFAVIRVDFFFLTSSRLWKSGDRKNTLLVSLVKTYLLNFLFDGLERIGLCRKRNEPVSCEMRISNSLLVSNFLFEAKLLPNSRSMFRVEFDS